MILFHGSNIKVAVPDLSVSKPFKDFGKGFYLSDNYEQAWEKAIQKVKQTHVGEPVVSEFQFDENLLHSDELRIKNCIMPKASLSSIISVVTEPCKN